NRAQPLGELCTVALSRVSASGVLSHPSPPASASEPPERTTPFPRHRHAASAPCPPCGRSHRSCALRYKLATWASNVARWPLRQQLHLRSAARGRSPGVEERPQRARAQLLWPAEATEDAGDIGARLPWPT